MEAFFLCLGLSGSAFLAATILPLSSEAALSATLLAGLHPVLALVSAVLGNVLGSMTTFYLGRLGKVEWLRKYCNISEEDLSKTQNRIGKYGFLAAFFVFVPVIGDGIAAALGFMRCPTMKFIIFMASGKILRYALWISFHRTLLGD